MNDVVEVWAIRRERLMGSIRMSHCRIVQPEDGFVRAETCCCKLLNDN